MMTARQASVAWARRRATVWLPLLACAGLIGAAAAAPSSESDRIVAVLGLEPGDSVADVGAGNGDWTEELSRAVGVGGRVFSTEVVTDLVDGLRRRFSGGNVTVVMGSDDSTGLSPECCDAILLRLVYHHLAKPKPIVADLHRALRPGGRVAIIDMRPQENHLSPVAGTPDRGGHGIDPDDLIREMGEGGFRVQARHDAWPGWSERFCVVFARD